ncbi:MAG TPA: VWA domain-containing protein [Vicinamibacteria bacterium]
MRIPHAIPALLLIGTTAAAAAEVRTVSVTVTDEKGTPLRGLSAEEVVVLENGVARAVTRIEADERPLTVALLVDTSAPMGSLYRLNVLDPVLAFLGRLPAGARYAVWTLGDRPQKVVDFTAESGEASRALKRVIPIGGNTLLDALLEVSDALKKQEGERTALVVVTGSGLGFASQDRRTVVDKLKGSGLPVYAVQFDEVGDAGVQGAGPDQVGRLDYDFVLGALTKESGGIWERPLSAMGVDRALRKVSSELTGQYRVSYDATQKEGKVEVQVARQGAKVRVAPAPAAR